ncbi:hypothetical protein [Chryseobacterium gambrini]|uniref:hypothetical protein n=1 Tax=Chryseobacterium gambrini TaxID=373672 RepID=UPI0022F3F609|nr:hypothetical protein [Chryseobacterium gambrini]WBX95977.1 hypothetical protein PE065_14030 [Chryseobacterium gambrini]
MKKFTKLSREQLRDVLGGRRCSIAIQQPNGTWETNYGTCGFVMGSHGLGSYQCNIGTGKTYQLSSNGGVSHCED